MRVGGSGTTESSASRSDSFIRWFSPLITYQLAIITNLIHLISESLWSSESLYRYQVLNGFGQNGLANIGTKIAEGEFSRYQELFLACFEENSISAYLMSHTMAKALQFSQWLTQPNYRSMQGCCGVSKIFPNIFYSQIFYSSKTRSNVFSCMVALFYIRRIPSGAFVISLTIRAANDGVNLNWNHAAVSLSSDRQVLLITVRAWAAHCVAPSRIVAHREHERHWKPLPANRKARSIDDAEFPVNARLSATPFISFALQSTELLATSHVHDCCNLEWKRGFCWVTRERKTFDYLPWSDIGNRLWS